MANARARERQQCQQPRAHQQRHQRPARSAQAEALRRAQPQRVEECMDHGEFAHKAGQGRQTCNHQRAGHERQAQKGRSGGDDLADQRLFLVVQVHALRGYQVGRQKGRVVGLLVRSQVGTVVAPAVDQVGKQEQRAHGQRGAEQVVQQPAGEQVLTEAHSGQQRAR